VVDPPIYTTPGDGNDLDRSIALDPSLTLAPAE
jgi:hypothetical protein